MLLPRHKARTDKIFFNYRRDDAGGFAGRLSDTLTAHFGAGFRPKQTAGRGPKK